MKNIDHFNLACARILSDLYERFPVPSTLDPGAIAERINGDLHCEELQDPQRLIRATIEFLNDEDLIRSRSTAEQRGPIYAAMTLTSKGLAILNQPIESLEAQVSTGERLKGLAANVARQALSEAVSLVMRASSGA